MTETETLQKRIADQREELGKLQKFHDDHQRGIRQPIGGYVEAEPLREALSELIDRRTNDRDKHELLSEPWWVLQHQIDGIKSAMGQIDATIKGQEAKPKRRARKPE